MSTPIYFETYADIKDNALDRLIIQTLLQEYWDLKRQILGKMLTHTHTHMHKKLSANNGHAIFRGGGGSKQERNILYLYIIIISEVDLHWQ